MKILMLGWELPPHNSGGLGVACYHLAKALSDEGVSIDFVVPYTAHHDDISFMNVRNATDYSPLHKFGMGAYSTDTKTLDKPTASTPKHPGSIRTLQAKYKNYIESLAETEKYDAIHAHDWLTAEAGIRAKELFNIPLVIHVHATEFDRAGGSSGNPLIHEIEYQGLINADRIVAVSALTKKIIVERYGIPEDKVDVVHNAIDTTSFDGQGYAYDQGTYSYLESLKSSGHTVVSAVTRLTVQKGLTYLVEAFAKAITKHDKMVLLVAGDGEQRDELIRLAAQHRISDKVFFTGFVRGKQWRDAYSVSDVFVLSSVSEPFGLTALEAAHHKTALITTNQSGVSEVLSSIFTYDFWDTDRLADQLVGIAKSESLRKSLQENVMKEYTRISWNDIAKKCIRNYEGAYA